jgi:hypothetical protein
VDVDSDLRLLRTALSGGIVQWPRTVAPQAVRETHSRKQPRIVLWSSCSWPRPPC